MAESRMWFDKFNLLNYFLIVNFKFIIKGEGQYAV